MYAYKNELGNNSLLIAMLLSCRWHVSDNMQPGPYKPHTDAPAELDACLSVISGICSNVFKVRVGGIRLVLGLWASAGARFILTYAACVFIW